jgi:hypothetical protein
MSYPTLRHFDSAAGIVVLLLLIVAVISSQSAISSDGQPVAGPESWTISQSDKQRNSSNMPVSNPESVLSLHIVSAGLALPNDVQLRENRDDRPSALDD